MWLSEGIRVERFPQEREIGMGRVGKTSRGYHDDVYRGRWKSAKSVEHTFRNEVGWGDEEATEEREAGNTAWRGTSCFV